MPSTIDISPRKLPRQARSEALVAAVLDAAARILEDHGFEGYTTNAVAKLAGVGIGSLYQYFPNKDAITRALIAREADRLLAELEEGTAAVHGEEALDRLIAIEVRHHLARPTLARLLDVEERRLPLGPDAARLSARVTAVIGRCLEDMPQAEETAQTPHLVTDLLAIMRGLIDAAGAEGECDGNGLIKRVRRAVAGYLGSGPLDVKGSI